MHMMTRLVLAFWLGLCLLAPMWLASASASHPGRSVRQPETRAVAAGISYSPFPDSPLGHFLYYLGQRQQKEAQEAFNQLGTFEDRYRALEQAVYPVHYPAGTREVVTACAGIALKNGRDPYRRAPIYRVLAKMTYRLRDADAALEHARKAIQLNPRSPWGWFWLAGVCWFRKFYAAEATARKRELSLFTGSTKYDSLQRAHIYSKLGLLYTYPFCQPETAIRYYQREIDETMKLPADGEYRDYRVARCGGSVMNILSIEVQALHDLPRAQRTLEWAATIIPSFPNEPLDQAHILRLRLRLPSAETPSR